MRCLDDKVALSGAKWSGCYSPNACRDWGYCRNRNLEAGGMANVTPEMQREWRILDNRERAE